MDYNIYNRKSDILYSTDSVEYPTWICSLFRISKEQMKDIIRRKNLTRSKHEKLQYDIYRDNFSIVIEKICGKVKFCVRLSSIYFGDVPNDEGR